VRSAEPPQAQSLGRRWCIPRSIRLPPLIALAGALWTAC